MVSSANPPATSQAPSRHNRPMSRPRILSGIQPTSESFHIGNYFGALRHWVALQDDNDAFYCVVDLHAITVPVDPVLQRERTRVSYAQLVAAGIDPERSTLFVQSDVPAHSQLGWVMMCLTGYGEASRMTQFKDKMAREGAGSASVGLFTYPCLQAADILLYQAAAVPVGEDQRQHLELTRDLAERFNGRFGETFVVPEPYIVKDTAKILDLQDPTSKMSKSIPAGCVFMLDSSKQIAKKIKSAVTDSETEVRFDPAAKPGVSNLISILAAATGRTVEDVEREYGGGMYGPLKVAAAEAVVAVAEPFARRTQELLDDPAELDRLMQAGAARAREAAQPTLDAVYSAMGLQASTA
ncbi:MAG: tryptophan--tRNA ligase [Actinobacteria bacterium]|nr:tryptophan--tRNA ligase [Actinomycetota bacterium]